MHRYTSSHLVLTPNHVTCRIHKQPVHFVSEDRRWTPNPSARSIAGNETGSNHTDNKGHPVYTRIHEGTQCDHIGMEWEYRSMQWTSGTLQREGISFGTRRREQRASPSIYAQYRHVADIHRDDTNTATLCAVACLHSNIPLSSMMTICHRSTMPRRFSTAVSTAHADPSWCSGTLVCLDAMWRSQRHRPFCSN